MVKKDRWNAACPFYQWDNGRNNICCEGVADGSTLHWVFRKNADFKVQIDAFCCDKFRNCEVYRLVNEKYENS